MSGLLEKPQNDRSLRHHNVMKMSWAKTPDPEDKQCLVESEQRRETPAGTPLLFIQPTRTMNKPEVETAHSDRHLDENSVTKHDKVFLVDIVITDCSSSHVTSSHVSRDTEDRLCARLSDVTLSQHSLADQSQTDKSLADQSETTADMPSLETSTSKPASSGLPTSNTNDSRSCESESKKYKKRKGKKNVRLLKKLAKQQRKWKSGEDIQFDVLVDEIGQEGDSGPEKDGKKKKIHAKRFAKTAGKRLWKGVRVSCKFLWSGLMLYAKPFGAMDMNIITKAWEEKQELDKKRQYYNYDERQRKPGVVRVPK